MSDAPPLLKTKHHLEPFQCTFIEAINEHKIITLWVAQLGMFQSLVGHVDCLLEELHH
jgi:hypothetical protein